LGCGTGRFSGLLSTFFDADVVGVDPSRKMLAIAEEKASARVRFELGAAESIPATDAAFDLVTLSMVFHHIVDRARAAGECGRVLRPGGYVVVRNSTADRLADFPYRPFFPAFDEIASARLPIKHDIETAFLDIGFSLVRHDAITHRLAADWPTYAEKIALRADSLLAAMPDDAFETGVAALRRYAESCEGPVAMPVDIFVFAKPATHSS
ncbi:MAG: class I SAM-dependent methyltransferase, partial [Alphaproteobacteria bacterium]|nr:class I SAM-dependent methyltransferase [Alphaproteobacteria bacterium]